MWAFPGIERANYTMADIRPGPDVDVIADLHALPDEWTGRYDAFWAGAVFEHLERPWIAAKEVARVLMPGGLCYVATHQTWPLHGHPSDFWRFSAEALALIFRDAGLEVLSVGYQHRLRIVLPLDVMPPDVARGPDRRRAQWLDEWNQLSPSYGVVKLAARKHG